MKSQLVLTAGLAMFGAFGFLATPAQGGVVLLGGEDGTSDPPAPTQGAETEEDWNPTVTCSVGTGEGILDLLTCLENEVSNPPPACPPETLVATSPRRVVEIQQNEDPEPCVQYPRDRQDFNVWVLLPPPDRWGIEIRRLDGSEIQRISLRENDPGIQTTELQLQQSARVARVRMVQGQPAGDGRVLVTVNDTIVSVPTTQFPTAIETNAEILRQLRGGPFQVEVAGEFFHVRTKKSPGSEGVRRVQFRSTDSGVIRSDLSLLPEGDDLLAKDMEFMTLP